MRNGSWIGESGGGVHGAARGFDIGKRLFETPYRRFIRSKHFCEKGKVPDAPVRRARRIRRDTLSALPFLFLRIGVHQCADHALVGDAALPRGALEEGYRALRQAQRHLYIVLAQHQPVRWRQEILNDPDAADLAFAVSNRWLFHRWPFLSAS